MRWIQAAQFVHLVSTGLLTGILFGDRWGVSPVRTQLPASCFVEYQQGLHLNFVPLMPILMSVSIVSGAFVLVALRRRSRSIQFACTALATIGVVVVLVHTRIINVPINDALMTWQASAPPADLREIWSRWEQAHTIRTIVSVVALVSSALAATVFSAQSNRRT
jgi:uncharacterized membrane protein